MTALGVCIVAGIWCGLLFIGGAISDYIAYRYGKANSVSGETRHGFGRRHIGK